MRRLTTSLLVLGALVWMVAPASAIWWFSREAGRTVLSEPATTYVPVQVNTDPVIVDVDLLITRSATPKVVAPALTGLVEQIFIAPGAELANGSLVLLADGVNRVGFASDRPFSRPLGRGDEGPDVPMLNSMLAAFGMTSGIGDEVGAATESGIGDLARALGASRETRVFDPNWVIFLPAARLTVAEVNLTVGAPTPPAGEVIVTGVPFLGAAQLVIPGSVPTPEQTEAGAGSSSSAPPASDVPDQASLVTASPEARLTLSEQELELDDSRTALSGAGLDTLAGLIEANDVVIPARLSTPAGQDEFVVPPAAMFSSADGGSCVLRRRDRNEMAIPVQLVGGSYDRTIVTGELAAGDELALSPPAEQRRCT